MCRASVMLSMCWCAPACNSRPKLPRESASFGAVKFAPLSRCIFSASRCFAPWPFVRRLPPKTHSANSLRHGGGLGTIVVCCRCRGNGLRDGDRFSRLFVVLLWSLRFFVFVLSCYLGPARSRDRSPLWSVVRLCRAFVVLSPIYGSVVCRSCGGWTVVGRVVERAVGWLRLGMTALGDFIRFFVPLIIPAILDSFNPMH